MEYEWMLRNLICFTFDKAFGKQSGGDWKPDKAMRWDFRHKNGGRLSLLLWAPANYVHVYARRDEGSPHDAKNLITWQHRGCHDSCWRDAVEVFLSVHSGVITHWDWIEPYKELDLTEEDQQTLRIITKRRQGYNDASSFLG